MNSMIRRMISTKDGLLIFSDNQVHKLVTGLNVQFQAQEISKHGSSNPIVARLGTQVKDLCDFYNLTNEQKDETFDIMSNKVGRHCLECYEIFKKTETKIVGIDAEIGKNGLSLQSNGRVGILPSVPNLVADAENFLYKAKSVLRDLTNIFRVLFDTNCKETENNLYQCILEQLKKRFGKNDVLIKQLSEDYTSWIKELIAKRNAVEHPGGHSGYLHINNFSYGEYRGRKGIAIPTWHRNSDKPTSILHDMGNYTHNNFTFAEEIFILSLQKCNLLVDVPMHIAEIPESERSKDMPVRFKMVIDNDAKGKSL